MASVLMELVTQRADSYFAGLSHLSEDAQLAAARRLMLWDVDRLEAELLAQVELVRDCLMMAANSMQDARLALLEQALAKVQTPDPKQVGEYIIEAVLTLAGELAVVLAPHLAAGVVAALVAPIATSSGTSVRALRSQLRALQASKGQLAAKTEKVRNEVIALNQQYAAQNATWELAIDSVARLDRRVTREEVVQHQGELLRAVALLDDIDGKFREARAQLRVAEDALPEVEKMIAAFVTGDVEAQSPIGKLAVKMRATTEARIGETLGTAIADASASGDGSGGGTSEPVFFTSDVLGRQLEACRERTVLIRLAMASLREALAGVTWDELLEDATWQQRVVDLCTVPALLAAQRAASALALPALVRSAEAILWYEWLSVTGALTVDAAAFYTHVSKTFGPGSPGVLGPDRVAGPYWLVRQVGAPRIWGNAATVAVTIENDYAAHYYPGLLTITEPQAAYLYERFARALVTADTPLPFKLADTDFSKISRLASKNFWGGENDEREQLIARQKIVVVAAFQELGARLNKAPQDVAATSTRFSSDDFQIPLTVLSEPDGGSAAADAVDAVDPISAWTSLRSDAMLAVRGLRDGINLHEGLREQINAMPDDPAAPRQAFERQRAQVVEQINRDKQTVAQAIARARELGSQDQLVRELNGAVAPNTVETLQNWTAKPTRVRFQTMPGIFTE